MRHPVEGVTKMNVLTLAALGTGFTDVYKRQAQRNAEWHDGYAHGGCCEDRCGLYGSELPAEEHRGLCRQRPAGKRRTE